MRRILCAILVATVVPGTLAVSAAEFYVARAGDDANPGTREKPFATLQRAREAIGERKQAGPLSEPVTVWLRGGVYRLSEPITFTPDDSGGTAYLDELTLKIAK